MSEPQPGRHTMRSVWSRLLPDRADPDWSVPFRSDPNLGAILGNGIQVRLTVRCRPEQEEMVRQAIADNDLTDAVDVELIP